MGGKGEDYFSLCVFAFSHPVTYKGDQRAGAKLSCLILRLSETFLTLAVKTDRYPTLFGSKPQTSGVSDKKPFMTALLLS